MAPPAEGVQNVVLLATEKTVFGFDLLETFRIAIGRHDSNDLTFKSRNVSNYHAEILIDGDSLTLNDLGSTNGTYVNESRVKSRPLQHGDRVRIGTHEITVRLANGESPESNPELTSVPPRGTFRRRGTDDDAPTLRELLVNLCRQRVSVRLVLKSQRHVPIEVFIHEGYIMSAVCGTAHGEKALYRAFEWHRGDFVIEPFPANGSVSRAMSIPIDTLVQEGEEQAAQIDELIGQLPAPDAPLRLRDSCKMRICDLTPTELEVFQAVIRHGTLGGAIQGCSMTDLRVMVHVHSLIRKAVFELQESASLLEQTNIITRY